MVVSMLFIIPIDIAFASGGAVGNYGTHTVKQQNAMCGGNSGTDVKSSLLLSIVTLCLPGILEKIYDWNQIKCQEVQCMYSAVKSNLDPSFCIGEAFALPPMAILEYFRKIIARILANPVGIAYSVAITLDRNYINTCLTKGGCSSTVAAAFAIPLTITDISALFQRLKDMLKNGFFPPGVKGSKNYCDGIKDIKKEMQLIVDNS